MNVHHMHIIKKGIMRTLGLIVDDTIFLQIVDDVVDFVFVPRPPIGQFDLAKSQVVVVESPQVVESQQVYAPTQFHAQKMMV